MTYKVPFTGLLAGDQNTIYAANSMVVTGTGGNVLVNSNVYVDASGNVGIGTNTPNAKLNVYGNIRITNAPSNSGIVFPDGTYQTTAFTGSVAPQSFGLPGTVQIAGAGNTFSGNGDTFFWDSANNRLGIGTNTPTNVLTVRSTATPAWFNTVNSAVGSNNFEIIVGNGTSTGTTIGYVNNTLVPYGYISAGTATRNLIIAANGRVGVGGVTAPQVLLDVGGGAVVGASWAGNTNFINPPTNGLAVQGSIGVGTYTPLATLDVRGGVGVTGTANFGGAVTVASLASNGAVSGTTGTFTGALYGASFNTAGTATVNALASNGAITGTTITGTTGTFTSIQNSGQTRSTEIVSNTWIHATQNLTVASSNASTTTATGAAVITGGVGIGGRLNVGGAAWFAGILNTSSNLIAQSINSNTNVVGVNIQSTGQTTLASAVVNTNITTTNLNSTGAAIVSSLASNGAVSGTTGTFTSALYGASFNTAGTATVNALVSNTSVQTATVNASSTIVGANIYSNGFVQASGTIEGNAIDSNTTITAGTGLTVTSGGVNVTGLSQFTGNVNIAGNLNVTGTISTQNANVLVVQDPIIYLGEGNTGTNWDLGIVGNYNDGVYEHTGFVRNHVTGVWTLFDTLPTEPNVNTGNVDWNNSSLTFAAFLVGNVNVAGQTESVSTTTGALRVPGQGGVGIGGRLNVGGAAWFAGTLNAGGALIAQSVNSNTNIVATNVQSTGQATVASLISNGAVSGTTGTFTGALYGANFNTAGTATVNALVSNGAVSGTTGTFTGALYGASFNTAGTATVNAVVSNGAITGTTITGTTATFTGSQNSGNERAANIVSNTWIHATQNLTVASSNASTTTATGAAVITGGVGIGGALNVGGAAWFASTLNAGGAFIAQSVNSNTNVVANNIQSTGQATVASLVSNGAVSGTTGTFTGALFGSNFNTAGTATVNALVSNGAVSGTTGTFTGALYGANFNSAGTATVNAVVSNGAITGTTITGTTGTFTSTQNSGNERAANIVSNTWIHATQNLTVASSNASTTTATGAAVITGGVGIGGALNVGGAAWFASTLNAGGAFIAQSVNSNTNVVATNIQSTGQATVASLVSNGAVSGTTGTFTGALFGSSFNSSGTATVNAVVSNGAITGTTVTGTVGTFTGIQNSGQDRAAEIVSNTWIHATQNLTVASSNASTTTATGAAVITGGVGIGGNINVGGTRNLFTGSIGIGTSSVLGTTSNVLSVYGTTMIYGNVRLVTPTGGTAGVYFSDGTYQTTAFTGVVTTPSFGTVGTIQVAGAANAFTGDSGTFVFDVTNDRLGIGTSTPTNSLSVWSTATPAFFNTTNSAVGSNNFEILIGNSTSHGTTVGYVNNATVPYGYLSAGFTSRNIVVAANGRTGFGGTTVPQNTVDINGNVAIGSAYAGARNAPANGLIVQGSVGIGTFTATQPLDVRGNAYVDGTHNLFTGHVGVGTSSALGASANVLSVYGTAMVYGNIDLGNVAAGGTGIYFSDGTFQNTAYVPTTYTTFTYTGNGSTTTYSTSPVTSSNINNTMVYVNGVYQRKETYGWSGTTITFDVAPPNFATIEIVVIQGINAPFGSVAGDISVNGNITISGGAIIASGSNTYVFNTVATGVYIGGNARDVQIGNAVSTTRFNSANASISTTTGAIVTPGGIGVGGNINVGGTRNLFTGSVGVGTSAVLGTTANVFSVYGTAMVYGNIDFGNPAGGTSGIYFADGSYLTSANTTTTYATKNANYTAVDGDKLLCDTSAGSFTVTLPATPSFGTTVIIYDKANFTVFPLTVARNGSTIEGLADDFSLDIGQTRNELIYDGATWHIYVSIGPRGLPGANASVSSSVAYSIALG